MALIGRLIQTPDRDGPGNMAIDEVLWDQAAEGMPYLRVYGWHPRPTISIGYFQSQSLFQSQQQWRSVPVVRRVTGGGAIVHDDDLTYCLALPARLSLRAGPLYERVHEAIARELGRTGIPATMGSPYPADGQADSLCFRRGDAYAVHLFDHKILGSAQRRRCQSVLMHGSFLLARSALAPDIPGIAELVGRKVDRLLVERATIVAIAAALDVQFEADELSAEARSCVERLAVAKYGSPLWNARR